MKRLLTLVLYFGFVLPTAFVLLWREVGITQAWKDILE